MQENITINEAVDLFLLDRAARRLTQQTKEGYKWRLSVFQRWCEGRKLLHLSDVTTVEIKRFQVELQGRECANRTDGRLLSDWYQHGVSRALRAFLYYCAEDGLIEASPKIRMPRMAKRIMPALTFDEIKTVLATCRTERDKAIVLFLLDTGLRASEYIALKVADIDLAAGTAIVRNGKGRKDRIVHIGKTTGEQLERYFVERQAQPDEPAFAARYGDHLQLYGSVQLMERLRRASGVKNLTAHTLRRTFAINCLRNGMNIYVLAKLMGHADITVLKHYLALLEDDLKAAHERYGVVDHLA